MLARVCLSTRSEHSFFQFLGEVKYSVMWRIIIAASFLSSGDYSTIALATLTAVLKLPQTVAFFSFAAICVDKRACGGAASFPCWNGGCTFPYNSCDNRDDCGDGSDEMLCGEYGFLILLTYVYARKFQIRTDADRMM